MTSDAFLRRKTKPLQIGDVIIGGDAPVVVQSMTNTDTRDVPSTVSQILSLEELGCEVVRVAVPDQEAAAAISAIKPAMHIPLVADIHFDYRLALAALEAGADALRLNPGNIRNVEHVKAVVQAAKRRGAPIRIGVNAGSLPPLEHVAASENRKDISRGIPSRMVEAALKHVRLLESLDFDLIKVSLKAFDVPTTIEAYRLMAGRVPYPFHLGITEAGTPRSGSIRSAVGLGALLYLGLGDTIRVSLTGDPREEISVAYEILKSLNLRQRGLTLVSFPGCGRTAIDLIDLAGEVEKRLQRVDKPIKVAVMGCAVNGPGEAREADVGVAGGKGRGVIFREGQIIRSVNEDELLEALLAEVNRWLEEHN
ncbi:MAG: flavodoxin-dependent (E)-4-hydroxy-3-methylbut-2-enyl-diphosphate synthase [Chloroflexi bacterium]|nr:flavodoxin-dependent (E)-4-hydroxy-3-methylbut-2-enyl-diphosphate synthase [Chloroflexota bacterium]